MRRSIDPRVGPMRRSAWALAAAMLGLVAGCGDGVPKVGTLYPVRGKLTLPDGKPAANLKLVFTGPVTSGLVTGADGTFASTGDNSGLPAGDYRIRLESVEPKGSLKKP